MFNRKSQFEGWKWRDSPRAAFTLVEILVAVGVLSILGVALVGLMMAGVGAWRDGEAARQAQEKVQALQRQIADDFAAVVVDPLPTPDFHYVLDTLADLPSDASDPSYIVSPGLVSHTSDSFSDLWYFGSGQVDLTIHIPFGVGAAVLSARMDAFDKQADIRLEIARNDPNGQDPTKADPDSWRQIDSLNTDHLHDGAIGGADACVDFSVTAKDPTVKDPIRGDILFIHATITGNAQFLRAETFPQTNGYYVPRRAEGRPVLILDCYRDANALPRVPRPVFRAWSENGSHVLMFTRTIPGETEKAALRNAASDPNGAEWLNYYDDEGDHTGPIDEPGKLRPLGGRATVVYRFEPYSAAVNKPGLGVLKRGFEAPIGRSIDQIPTFELIPNVAYFGVSFWGGDTTTWEPNPELDPNYAKVTPAPHPASERWISSRYLPRQAQVTLVVEPDGGRRTTTALSRALPVAFPTGSSEADRLLFVDNTRGFYNADPFRKQYTDTSGVPVDRTSDTTQAFVRDPRHYVKIGGEWVYYERVASPSAFLAGLTDAKGQLTPNSARGQRGTTAGDWPVQTDVLRGTTSVFTVPIPAFRDWQR